MCDQTTNTTEQIRAGTSAPLRCGTTPERLAALPDVPTSAQGGLAGLRGVGLAWDVCPERHAGADRRAA